LYQNLKMIKNKDPPREMFDFIQHTRFFCFVTYIQVTVPDRRSTKPPMGFVPFEKGPHPF